MVTVVNFECVGRGVDLSVYRIIGGQTKKLPVLVILFFFSRVLVGARRTAFSRLETGPKYFWRGGVDSDSALFARLENYLESNDYCCFPPLW